MNRREENRGNIALGRGKNSGKPNYGRLTVSWILFHYLLIINVFHHIHYVQRGFAEARKIS